MEIPIIIQNAEIIFNYSPDTNTELRSVYELATWVTDYGYIIPYDYTSINLKMFLMTGMVDQNPFITTKGLLLGNDGILRKIAINFNSEIYIDINMIDCHKFNKHVIGTAQAETHINALFSLGYSNDEILNYLIKHTSINMKCVVKHRILDIMKTQLEFCKDPKIFHSSVFTRNMPKREQNDKNTP